MLDPGGSAGRKRGIRGRTPPPPRDKPVRAAQPPKRAPQPQTRAPYGQPGFTPAIQRRSNPGGGSRATQPRFNATNPGSRYQPGPGSGFQPGGPGGSQPPRPANTGATSTGQVTPAAQPPKPPSIDEWLAGDTTFQDQESAIKKALADYEADMNRQKGQYNTEFETNLGNIQTSQDAAQNDMLNDFASRGMLNSGVYANSLSELLADYNQRRSQLETGRSNWLADLAGAFQNFQSEQELVGQRARQDAINRRAAQFGL